MDRRAFLRNAGILAAGLVAADQLEIVERIGWRRRFFGTGPMDQTARLQAMLDRGGVVVFPPGIHEITRPLILRSNTTWRDSSVKYVGKQTPAPLVVHGDYISIIGNYIDGDNRTDACMVFDTNSEDCSVTFSNTIASGRGYSC